MNWFKNLSIATRLACAFTVLIGIGGALGGFRITRLAPVRDHAEVLARETLGGTTAAAHLSQQAGEVRRHLLARLTDTTAEDRRAAEEALASTVAAFSNELAAYSAR